MIRSLDQLHKQGTRVALNKIYYEMIGLCIMYKDYEYSGKAAKYAKKVISISSFNTHRINAPDLYNLFVYFTNISKFDLSKKDVILLKRSSLEINRYVRLLRKMSTGSLNIIELNNFIRYITKELYIEDNILRSLGRLAISWNKIGLREKALTLTKMERYGVIHNRYSKITTYVKEMKKNISVEDGVLDRRSEKDKKDTKIPSDSKYSSKGSSTLTNLTVGALGGYALSKFLNRNKDTYYSRKPEKHLGYNDLYKN